MSYNRGVKRDSFGNRNFKGNNRSMGGNMGGGGGGGNRMNMGGNMSGGNGGGGGGMNPWESGMMPGRGILPTPNNNLSLASPQAQLAIASNLLTNILRNQTENQPQTVKKFRGNVEMPEQGVPSLLSLGNSFGPGNNYNQQNYQSNRYPPDRAQVRGHSGPGGPMKNQRPQPYNKMGNRARDGLGGRGPSTAQHNRAPQSGNQRNKGFQNQHRNDKQSSKANSASKQSQAAKQQEQQQDIKTPDKEKADASVDKSEKKEEQSDKSQDNAIAKEDDVKATDSPSTESAAKSEEEDKSKSNVSVDDKDNKGTKNKSEARHAESRYSEVPMDHMVCHVCNKRMWDGSSFENHLRGRAHQLMMEKLDESYKLKVDLMRHELRVAEERRELSLTNSKRRGKKVSVDLNIREYCTMCDLNFYGTLSNHRKSEKHQQLKTFLHPRCFACVKEFPSRIEYDEHCLTPGHMKNAVQTEEQRKTKKRDKLLKGESEVRSAEDEDKDTPEVKSEKEEDNIDASQFVLDLSDLQENKQQIPTYKQCRQKHLSVGRSLVKEVTGFYCEKCRRFMLLEEDLNAHLRCITHYRNFAQEIKALTTETTTAEKGSDDSTKNETETNNSTTGGDFENAAKRPKLDESEVVEPSSEAMDCSKVETNDDSEKYDPMEAELEGQKDDEESAKGNNVDSETKDGNGNNEANDESWQEEDPGKETEGLDESNASKDNSLNESKSNKLESSIEYRSTPGRGRNYRGRGGPRARRSRK